MCAQKKTLETTRINLAEAQSDLSTCQSANGSLSAEIELAREVAAQNEQERFVAERIAEAVRDQRLRERQQAEEQIGNLREQLSSVDQTVCSAASVRSDFVRLYNAATGD
jgi:phosphoglycerate-specific signal transduction histidine kinase